jgi:hypothetical protein
LLTPEQRVLRGKLAAHRLHAQVQDPSAHTLPARQKFLERFLDEVDAERVLPEAERLKRAEHARKAYFTKLAFASSKARARKKAS